MHILKEMMTNSQVSLSCEKSCLIFSQLTQFRLQGLACIAQLDLCEYKFHHLKTNSPLDFQFYVITKAFLRCRIKAKNSNKWSGLQRRWFKKGSFARCSGTSLCKCEKGLHYFVSADLPSILPTLPSPNPKLWLAPVSLVTSIFPQEFPLGWSTFISSCCVFKSPVFTAYLLYSVGGQMNETVV